MQSLIYSINGHHEVMFFDSPNVVAFSVKDLPRVLSTTAHTKELG